MFTTPTGTEASLSLKLLIDRKANRVLFAEAGKEFVDFLFSLMSLPIGTVTRLLSADKMIGSLGKVYRSLETLSDKYLQPQANRFALLWPNAAVSDGAAKLLSLPSSVANDSCPNSSRFSTSSLFASNVCSSSSSFGFGNASSSSSVSGGGGGGGYVVEFVNYMVMDDLEVKPMSTISTIALINKFGFREIGDLQELVISIGKKEALKLLKASLVSKTVLTDVFLGKVAEIPK